MECYYESRSASPSGAKTSASFLARLGAGTDTPSNLQTPRGREE